LAFLPAAHEVNAKSGEFAVVVIFGKSFGAAMGDKAYWLR